MQLKKIKLFTSLSFFDFLIKKDTWSINDKAYADLLTKKVSNIYPNGNFILNEKESQIIIYDIVINNKNFKDIAKITFIFIAYMAYPMQSLKEKYLKILNAMEITSDSKSSFRELINFKDEPIRTMMGDICREALDTCFYDEWLYLNQESFFKVATQSIGIIEKFDAVFSKFDPNGDILQNKFYENFINFSNYQQSAKGGLTASQNRNSKEKKLKEKAIKLYISNNPKTNKRWKSRNEFYDYFTTVTNRNINDENDWVSTSTVKRWITHHLANSKI